MSTQTIPLATCLLALLALAVPAPLAAQVRVQQFDPAKLPGFPGFPGFDPAKPGELPSFDPQKMFDQFFGKGGAGDASDEALAKVEVTFEEESKLGKQALDALKQQLAARRSELVTRGKEVDYLSRLVELLRPQMTQASRYRKLHVYLIESNDPDAYSLPGGQVLFSRALIEAAGCEAALVAAAGHELAHLDRGHLLRRTRQWKLAQESFQPGKAATPDKMMQMMSRMPRLFSRPFGPEEELDADRDGIQWAFALGYDPRAVMRIYDTFEANGKNGPEFMPAFLRTHPLTAERRENLQKSFVELSAANSRARLYIGRENFERKLTRKQREFPE
jgi:beta-barrel assembly-enhancing protease